MTDEEVALRLEVLGVYGYSCACCGLSTAEFLNVVPVRLGPDGKQMMRSGDAPMPERAMQRLKTKGYPDGYVVFCSNCVVSHPLGTCPYAG